MIVEWSPSGYYAVTKVSTKYLQGVYILLLIYY